MFANSVEHHADEKDKGQMFAQPLMDAPVNEGNNGQIKFFNAQFADVVEKCF
jgi:hypothetical protein